MPSYTSNSDAPVEVAPTDSHKTVRWIFILLVLLLIGEAALQMTANWVMRTHGKNEMQWARERQAANDLVHDGKGVLIMGSSIVRGIKTNELQQSMPDWTVRRMVMVSTGYLDWYYALRRLENEGVRPDYVVITPLPFQFWVTSFRGDYSSLHYLDRKDIPDVAHRLGLDMNATSNLYAASVNRFFALREDMRNSFMGTLIPGHKALIVGQPDQHVYKKGELEGIITERLIELRSELAKHGAKLLILYYPVPGEENGWVKLRTVMQQQNIPLVVPVESTPKSDFEDLYHLNAAGEEYYTKALGPALHDGLVKLRGR